MCLVGWGTNVAAPAQGSASEPAGHRAAESIPHITPGQTEIHPGLFAPEHVSHLDSTASFVAHFLSPVLECTTGPENGTRKVVNKSFLNGELAVTERVPQGMTE